MKYILYIILTTALLLAGCSVIKSTSKQSKLPTVESDKRLLLSFIPTPEQVGNDYTVYKKRQASIPTILEGKKCEGREFADNISLPRAQALAYYKKVELQDSSNYDVRIYRLLSFDNTESAQKFYDHYIENVRVCWTQDPIWDGSYFYREIPFASFGVENADKFQFSHIELTDANGNIAQKYFAIIALKGRFVLVLSNKDENQLNKSVNTIIKKLR